MLGTFDNFDEPRLTSVIVLTLTYAPTHHFLSVPSLHCNHTAAARGEPRHDQRILCGVYGPYVLERCISQSEQSMWRCVQSSPESGDDENELACVIRPNMNVSDRTFGCYVK